MNEEIRVMGYPVRGRQNCKLFPCSDGVYRMQYELAALSPVGLSAFARRLEEKGCLYPGLLTDGPKPLGRGLTSGLSKLSDRPRHENLRKLELGKWEKEQIEKEQAC